MEADQDYRTLEAQRSLRRGRVWVALAVLVVTGLGAGAYWLVSKLEFQGIGADAHYEQALRAHRSGATHSAIVELKSALVKNAHHVKARALLAELYVDRGYADAAHKEVEWLRLSGIAPTRLRMLELELLALDGEYQALENALHDADPADLEPALLVLLARAKLGLGQLETAANLFRQLIVTDARQVDALIGLAEVHFALRRYEDVDRYVDDVLSREPENFEAQRIRAETALNLGDFASAHATFKRLLVIKPDSLVVRVGLIRSALEGDDLETAAREARVLVESNPDHLLGHYFQALVSRREGDYERAKSALRAVLERHPEHEESRTLLGQTYIDAGELEAAESELVALTRANPESDTLRYLLADVYLRLERADESISLLLPVADRLDVEPRYHQLLGDAYFNKRQYPQAKRHLRLAVLLSPDDPALRGRLALASLATGDEARYAAEMKAAAEMSPAYKPNEITLISSLLQAGRFGEALGRANALSAADPADAAPKVLIGGIHEARGGRTAAQRLYQEALALEPGHSAASLNLARMAVSDGNLERARNLLEDANGRHPGDITVLSKLASLALDLDHAEAAIGYLESIRQSAPDHLESRLELAALYSRYHRLDLAWPVAEEALLLSSADPTVLFEVGRARFGVGRYQQAATAFLQLIEQYPEHADAHYFLGSAELELGNLDDALAALDRALQLNPAHLAARFETGRLLVRSGRYQEAVALGRRISEEYPADPRGFMLQGDAEWGLQRRQDALSRYHFAFELEPSSGLVMRIAEANRLLGNLKQGNAVQRDWLEHHPNDTVIRLSLAASLSANGDEQAAQAEYEQVLRIQPDSTVALNNLAWLIRESEPKKALGLAREAHEFAPDDPELTDTYAWLLVLNEQPEQGVELLTDVLLNAPGHKVAIYHFAYGLAKLGRHDEALDWLSSLLKSGEPFEEREQVERLWKELGG